MEETMGRLRLPGVVLMGCEKVIVRTTRGDSITGCFRGFAYGMVALSAGCGEPPSRFVAMKRVLEIVVVGRCEE